MKIAVEGCAHGELEKIYETLEALQKMENTKIDLLLCCGDFQATRNLADLQTMAVPPKYLDICTFYKYYSGELLAPVLTLFVGGNHEASNYLQELPYGGWVAPNIYYLGYAGVVRINGVRIGGISGIYKGRDYTRGHFEYCPYSEDTKRSVYHVRQLEVFRMKQLSGNVDICMSHDWPSGIHNYGNKSQLLRFKPHFREDIENEQLGSKPCMELLLKLQPTYWFAAHLHCKFAGLVPHEVPDGNDIKITKFLALDKCMPRRRFLQICDIPDVEENSGDLKFEYDLEWLTILHLTNHLLSVKQGNQYMPGPSAPNERYDFTPTEEEKQQLLEKLGGNLSIPTNFCRTVDPHKIDEMPNNWKSLPQPQPLINPQTTQFCDLLGIDDPVSLALLINGGELKHATDLNERSILESTENEDYLNISASNSPVQEKDLSMELESKDDENPKMELDGGDCENEEQKEIDENEEGSREAEDHREIDKAEEDPIEVPKEPEEGPCESNVPGETQIKKFKRRNQEIYSEPPLDINADC